MVEVISAREAVERKNAADAKFKAFCDEHRDDINDTLNEAIRKVSKRGHNQLYLGCIAREFLIKFNNKPTTKKGEYHDFRYVGDYEPIAKVVAEVLFDRETLENRGFTLTTYADRDRVEECLWLSRYYDDVYIHW